MSGRTLSSWIETLRDWPDLVSTGLRVTGLSGAIVFFVLTRMGWLPLPSQDGWGLTAFAAEGAMAGFMMAALSLILAAKNADVMEPMIRSPAWNGLLDAIVVSMFAWATSATLALFIWLAAWSTATPFFMGLTVWSAAESLRAMLWVYATVRRFRSWSP